MSPIFQLPLTFFEHWAKYARHARSQCSTWGMVVESKGKEASHLVYTLGGSYNPRAQSSQLWLLNVVATVGQDGGDIWSIARWQSTIGLKSTQVKYPIGCCLAFNIGQSTSTWCNQLLSMWLNALNCLFVVDLVTNNCVCIIDYWLVVGPYSCMLVCSQHGNRSRFVHCLL